jgi:hypothetical protein
MSTICVDNASAGNNQSAKAMSMRDTRCLVITALIALAGSANGAHAQERFTPWLTAFDGLAEQGGTASLEAKLEQPGLWALHFHMRGYPLRFTCPGMLDHEATTTEDGIATIRLRLPSSCAGVYPLTVSFAGSGHHQQARATARLFVWPANSRILITDIDHTISDLSQLKVPFTPNEQTPPLTGAVENLRAISANYRIIYLSARDDVLYQRTQLWLAEKGFPAGPLFCRDFHLGGTQEGFKRHVIAELKKRFPRIEVGVGDKASDARAYLGNGLKTFLIEPKQGGPVPKEAIIVRSWHDLTQRLSGNQTRN